MRREIPDPEPPVPRILAEHLPEGRLSIAVFGPGEGEAVVVKLPDGRVGVVDGCREPDDPVSGAGDPVRELLNDLAVTDIEFVCLTHPHQDHYRGLGRLLEHWPGRVRAIWKPPGSTRYLAALLARLRAEDLPELQSEQDAPGLERVLKHVRSRRDSRATAIVTQTRRRPLLWDPLDPAAASVWCCGPDDSDADRAEEAVLSALDDLLGKKERPRSVIDVNLTSSALLLRWGRAGVLLAGDLLAQHGRFEGWAAAHATIGSEPVQVVNVAHHASREAHDADLWARMNPRLAIVTPFKNAVLGNPPQPDMIRELAAACDVVITSPPGWVDAGGVSPRRGWPAQRTEPAARSKALRLAPAGRTPAWVSPHAPNGSAVAVSLDRDGTIRSVVLAGAADFYGPVTPSE